MRSRLISLVPVFTLLASDAQTLQDQRFQIAYGPTGIVSLRDTRDSYPTEYLAAGRTLGDHVIRYRHAGASSPATPAFVGTPIPTAALNDQVDPQTSRDNIARFTWQSRSGTQVRLARR